MEVQDTIRKMRELNQLTQEEMAEKLNISVNGYSKIERGITKLSLKKLEQIANIFNINVSELYSAKEKGFLYFLVSIMEQIIIMLQKVLLQRMKD